jgi:hypothetical protein
VFQRFNIGYRVTIHAASVSALPRVCALLEGRICYDFVVYFTVDTENNPSIAAYGASWI